MKSGLRVMDYKGIKTPGPRASTTFPTCTL